MLAGKRLTVVLVTPAGSNLGECMDVIVRFFHAAKPQLLPISILPQLYTLPSNRPAERWLFLSNRRSPKAKNLIMIIIFINCNWVITRWQWLFYMYTNMEKK